MLMAPLVRRTWSPVGRTPILYQRTASHTKVSMVAALCIKLRRRKAAMYFRLHPAKNINAPLTKDFLVQLRKQVKGPLIVVWDRFMPHRSKIVNEAARDKGIILHCLPPYAPELNAVEYLWGYLKTNPLANHAESDVNMLADVVRKQGKRLQRKHALLDSFLRHSPLSFDLK